MLGEFCGILYVSHLIYSSYVAACENLIMECLKFDPDERCDLEDVLYHPWLSEGDTSLPLPISELNAGRHKLGSIPAKLQMHAEQHPTLRYAIPSNGASESHLKNAFIQSPTGLGNKTPLASGATVAVASIQDSIWNHFHEFRPFIGGNVSASSSCSSASSGYGTTSSPPTGSLMLGSY